MKKAVLGTTILLTSLAVNANGTLSFLKQAPATKYEVAKMKMELISYALTQESKGQRLPNSSFKIEGFSVKEGDSTLNLLLKAKGKAKDMSPDTCKKFINILSERPFSKMSLKNYGLAYLLSNIWNLEAW